MSEIRVMHLISGGDTGGAKTHVINLINGLNDRIPTILVTLMESDFSEDAKELNLPLFILNQKSRLDLSVTKPIYQLIEKHKINLIHVHGARANVIATFVKKEYPAIPIVTTIHSDYLLDDYRGGKLFTTLFRMINERALRKMDYYIGVSDNFKDMMIERGFGNREKIFAVYNGIDFTNEVIVDYKRAEFFEKYGLEYDPNCHYIGIMGRMDPVKDHYTFLKAAKCVLEEFENVQFLLAGTGSLKEALEAYSKELNIDEKVHFMGYVTEPFDFYDAIEINVLTSLSESFPYAMLEGARMKRPMVSTQVGGVDKVIKNGETGYIVNVGDHQCVAERLLTLLKDDALRKEMGENIYELVSKNYSHRHFIDKHIEIYSKILEDC